MQQLVIDCTTGRATYIDLSPTEESRRLQETEQNRLEEARLEVTELKRILARELAELREMTALPTVYTAREVTEKQAAIDELIGRVR